MEKFKDFSQTSVEASKSGEIGGLTTEFIVLNKTLGLPACLLIKSEVFCSGSFGCSLESYQLFNSNVNC